MSVLDRASLEESPLADLHALASELGIDGFRRLRKSQLVDRILGEESPEADAAPAKPARAPRARRSSTRDAATTPSDDSDADVDVAEADVDSEADSDSDDERPRRTRTRGGRGRSSSRSGGSGSGSGRRTRNADPGPGPDDSDIETEEEAAAAAAARSGSGAGSASSSGSGESKRPRRSRTRGGNGGGGADAEPETGEERAVEGVVELLGNGSGFLRVSPPDPSDDDVYVSAAQVRRCELVSGDRVAGPMRPPRRSERYPSLVRVDTINGRSADEVAEGTHFDDLPAAWPTKRLALGADDPTLKAIEWLTPIGRGSRAVIAGPPRSGKSEALHRLAAALAPQEDLEVTLVLAGARPEEVTEAKGGPVEPVAALTFAASAEAQSQAVERAVETAKRIAARGADAVVLIDSLDGLHPHTAHRVLAAARDIVDGGSLTVIATAAAPLGGETTVVALDPLLTSTGRFPALDLVASGSLRAELLVGEAGADAITQARGAALG